MISIKNVSKWYGSLQVLTRCSTEVKKGEVVVVCGPSGSGKSTFIKCVNGLEPFQEGEIIVDGISVNDPGTDLPKLRARIGMVFQNFELFPHMSVTRNLTLAQTKVLGRSLEEATRKGLALLELTGRARSMQEFSFRVFEAFTAATVIYLLTNLIVVVLMRALEKKVRVPGLIAAAGAPQAGH